MEELVYVDRMGKEYQVLQQFPFAHLYEDGYEIFKGSLKDIENLGLSFKRKGVVEVERNEL